MSRYCGVSVPLLHNILQVVDVIHEDRYSVVVFEAFDVLEGCGIVDARVIVFVFEFLQHADAVVVLLLGGLVVLHTPSKALLVVVLDIHETTACVVVGRRRWDVGGRAGYPCSVDFDEDGRYSPYLPARPLRQSVLDAVSQSSQQVLDCIGEVASG